MAEAALPQNAAAIDTSAINTSAIDASTIYEPSLFGTYSKKIGIIIKKLYEHVAKGALHDSQERSRDVDLQIVDDIINEWKARFRMSSISAADPKSPAPWPSESLSDLLVVEDIIKDVLIWLLDPFTHSLAMWLYDDKNACTSLVAQVVAEILSQRKELSATYFFSRQSRTRK